MFGVSLPVWGDVLVFLAAAAAIGLAGTKLAGLADRFADRTGLGEALTGSLLLGLTTALPGVSASVVAALEGSPTLAITNALGGIAFQTTVLAVADMTYRRANLEHAAASAENMMQTVMLIVLISLVLVGFGCPDVTVGHVHPISILLLVTAGLAFYLVHRVRKAPMWKPTQTEETVEDVPEPDAGAESLAWLIAGLVGFGIITLASGAVVAHFAKNIVEETPIPEVVVGGLFMALATSLPELFTSIAAIRRGALTLAVGDIVGGNFFDVLFVAAADFAYLRGSLFHGTNVGGHEWLVTSLTLLLNAVLMAGLIYRQRHGPANIGFESVLMLAIYVAGFLTLSLAL